MQIWRETSSIENFLLKCLILIIYNYILIAKLYSVLGGTTKHWNLFIKNCVFILTCFNFSHLQSTLHVMQYTYLDVFSTAPNCFWILKSLWVLLLFLFHLFHICKTFTFEDFFHLGKHEKAAQGNSEGGPWGSCLFFVKNCWTLSVVWALILINHPS